MPKNEVSELITDQEIAFARLILSGTMTDRAAAQAVGLNPDTAAYIKSRPPVRAYMVEHRAAVQRQLVEQETEGLRQLDLGREQVLARLWEIANLSPEMTRGSITGQVKALSMIVAIQGLIPDRRAASSRKESAPPPAYPGFYKAAWLRQQEGETVDAHPGPALAQEEEEPGLAEPELPPPGIAPRPASAASFSPEQTTPSAPPAPVSVAPDTRIPFSIKKNPFARRR